MRLSGLVIRVLANDNHLDLVERRAVECLENLARRRIDDARLVGAAHVIGQQLEICAVKLRLEHLPPRFFDSYLHGDGMFLLSFNRPNQRTEWMGFY